MAPRRPARQIVLGDSRTSIVKVGGDAPISVQTMTSGYTNDISACIREINKLAAAGDGWLVSPCRRRNSLLTR